MEFTTYTWVLIFILDVCIGIIICMYWYSPKLDKIDDILDKMGSEELDWLKMTFWISLMVFLWWGLGPIEILNKFKHWYPEHISRLEIEEIETSYMIRKRT